MNYDELAVVCDQLAGMLRAGLTLPDALRELTPTLPQGRIRRELERMAAGLADGTPWAELVEQSQLSSLLQGTLAMGNHAGILPETLGRAADHYRRWHVLWSRMRLVTMYAGGMMLAGLLYVAGVTTALTVYRTAFIEVFELLIDGGKLPDLTIWVVKLTPAMMWCSWGAVMLLMAVISLISFSDTVRERLIWALPGAKETRLSMLASMIALLMGHGFALRDAMELVRHQSFAYGPMLELTKWSELLERGHTRFWTQTEIGQWFPSLFLMLVESTGLNVEAGFRRAADVYRGRAEYKTEMWQQYLLPWGMWVVATIVLVAVIILATTALAHFLPLIEIH